MCQNAEELKKMANWAGVKGGSREHLMDNICGKEFTHCAYQTLHYNKKHG